MGINRVVLSGNLTRDPELRQTSGGMAVLVFGIAVNDKRKNSQTGVWEDYPNFFDCTMFGTRAEALSKYLSKGIKVAIEGKLRWSQWERDGQKRSKVEVIVDSLDFMSGRNNGGSSASGAVQAAPVAQPAQVAGTPVGGATVNTSSEAYEEDIPF